ncbi:c-type cytochrome biogenesis protein CcmI [Pseudorhodoferax sp.]|uniref:c-type cytochrome biogenesis protein CcmI n=1 Tax=Pseudorhodoferax sp. TaxID=1993553 RepID=UPI002DD62A2C|nr:c-type cytochrome biogenesis protein CcmI [Pseudorhodoferax sp.]
MTGLWITLALLVALALLMLLPPLLRPRAATAGAGAGGVNVAVYRDQLREAERDLAADVITPERFEQLRAEIQRRVLEDTAHVPAPATASAARPARLTLWLLALLLPLASVLTYLQIGRPDALDPAALQAAQADVTPEQVEAMVATLAQRLKDNPENAEGWHMLGRSYAVLGRYPDAVAALRQALTRQPGNADLLADLADAVGMTQGRSLAGEPRRLLAQALEADATHPKALALAGSGAFEAGEYAAARGLWERLLALLPPESEAVQSVRGSIAEAREREGGAASAPAATRAAAASAAAPVAAAARTLSGEVLLAPELQARVPAGGVVYVYARAAQGPRMPLAALRQPVGAWPLRFTLDDSQAMVAGQTLSSAASVVVVARISRSGEAMPQAGDLVGETAPLAPGAAGVRVVIDRVQP